MTDITIAAPAIEPATSKKDTSCKIKYKLPRLRYVGPTVAAIAWAISPLRESCSASESPFRDQENPPRVKAIRPWYNS